jgi:hypothetical protein
MWQLFIMNMDDFGKINAVMLLILTNKAARETVVACLPKMLMLRFQ